MKLKTDEELMKDVAKGNSNAFRELFDRYASLILGYSQRILGGDRVKAEDISQKTWQKVVLKADQYQSKGSFRSWILTISRNEAIDEIRSQIRWKESNLQDEELIDVTQIERDFLEIERLKDWLESLPAPQRSSILLWGVEGLNYSEIAKTLELSESAIKSLIFRGRKQLRELKETKGRLEFQNA